MSKLKETLKSNKLIYKTWCSIKDKKNIIHNNYLDKQAISNFKKEKKINHKLTEDGKIKVGFLIAQNLSTWNKTEPIFLAMKKDDRFDITIVCLPPWYGEGRILFDNKLNNENYETLISLPEYKDTKIVNAWLGGDNWIDLKSFDFSYLFCTSPYNDFYPKEYKSNKISRYTKICYTPYGILLLDGEFHVCATWAFFRYIYCCYCDSKEDYSYFHKRLIEKNTSMFQRIAFYGYPALSGLMKKSKDIAPVWNFSKNNFRVLWTPRWSDSDSFGGSNFINYKDLFLAYANEHKDIDFVYRPHPLTFGNFIQKGQLSVSEVTLYKKNCETENTHLDESKEYGTTFWQSSVLVSDHSSIVFEYFAVGKPIIFCNTQTGIIKPIKVFQRIINACYIADTWEDVVKYLEELKAGNDPLLQKRKVLIKEIYGDDIEHIPERILEDLYLDYQNNKLK